jgi:dihydroxyacetone kinase-like protein
MHDLKTERFFKPEMVNDMNEVGDGAVKTTVSMLDGKAKALWDAPVHTAALRWGA